MRKNQFRVSILVLSVLLILAISVPVSAAQNESSLLPVTLQNPADSATPLYYGQHNWHHRYTRHGHTHHHLRHHERAHHRDCRYFEFDGLYHFPIHHR